MYKIPKLAETREDFEIFVQLRIGDIRENRKIFPFFTLRFLCIFTVDRFPIGGLNLIL